MCSRLEAPFFHFNIVHIPQISWIHFACTLVGSWRLRKTTQSHDYCLHGSRNLLLPNEKGQRSSKHTPIVAIWLVVNNTSIAGFAVAMILPSINKLLLAPKLAYFFFFFSYSSVSPFIAVFMSTNGLNPQQSGFIIGSRCFAQFLSGPVWGAIADKTNRNKVILMIQIIVSTVALFSTPWIPLALPKSRVGSARDEIDKPGRNRQAGTK